MSVLQKESPSKRHSLVGWMSIGVAMGRYSPLFKSVVILVIFWWLIGLITYSMMPYWALAQWLEHVGAPLSDRKSTRLNSSHVAISYAVFCLKKKNVYYRQHRFSPSRP